MDHLCFESVRDAYRRLCVDPGQNTISCLESANEIGSPDMRYRFWRQVAIYATYCFNFPIASKLNTMLVTKFHAQVIVSCGVVVPNELLAELLQLHIIDLVKGKNEVDLAEMNL